MNGPSRISAAPSAMTFGTKASVASLIWVIACNSATSRPTASATRSGGPPSFSITSMPSRNRTPISASFIAGSDRHLDDVLVRLDDAVTDGSRGLQREFGARPRGDDVGEATVTRDRRLGLVFGRLAGVYRALQRPLERGTEADRFTAS